MKTRRVTRKRLAIIKLFQLLDGIDDLVIQYFISKSANDYLEIVKQKVRVRELLEEVIKTEKNIKRKRVKLTKGTK